MTEIKLKHIQGKSYVDVRATVDEAKKALETNNSITLVARQTQISRIGMIIKIVEEQANCKATSFKNVNLVQTVDDKQGKKDVNVLYFRTVLTKN